MGIVIETPCGKVIGNKREKYNEWLGIKYANAGRFEDPVPVEHWDGVYDATKYGPRTMQYLGLFGHVEVEIQQFYRDDTKDLADYPGFDENALELNVWAPKDAKDCPVFMYIHGGGYASGSGNGPDFCDGTFAEEGIVTVTCNYRLSMFATGNGDGHTGNYATKDQIEAIKWVYRNISSFGGDPKRITIGGESAGAYSVQNMLNTPMLEDGIISGAIMMSGAGDTYPLTLTCTNEFQEAIWADVKAEAGVNSIDELKDFDAKKLYPIWKSATAKHQGPPCGQAIDGKYIIDYNKNLIEEGKTKNVPLLCGMLAQDMLPLMLYNGIIILGNARKTQGGAPVYSYLFDYQVDEKWGAYHGADITYAFNTIFLRNAPISDTDRKISKDLFGKLCNFIKTGDPNVGGADTGELSGRWLSMAESGNQFYEINGVKHGMFTPNTEELKIQTETKPSFPSKPLHD